MKTLLRIVLTAFAACVLLPVGAQTGNRDSLDFEFAVRQIEVNYAGYPSFVTDANRSEYEVLKERLRREIRNDKRLGYDAVGELFGWFGDFHLRSNPGSYYKNRRALSHPDYSSIEYDPQQIACKMDAQTYLIRIPSFALGVENENWIIRAIEDYKNSGCKYLIVDIRGNGGGRDHVYKPLLKLLYDHPCMTDNVEIRSTPEHEKFLREAIRKADGKIDWLLPVADSIAAGTSDFVAFPGGNEPIEYDSICSLPLHAAVLIDANVASSGEQFILEVRACSSRTTIYGRDNTLGCLDYSNIRPVDLPCCGLTCYVPMTRSQRVAAGRGVDQTGIAPDVLIPLPLPETLTDNIDTWVRWVAENMKTKN